MNNAEIEALDFRFCNETAKIINQFLLNTSIEIDQISSHGHTIYHYPEKQKTLQIGNGKSLAELCGFSVVTDFRSQDLRLGGQGAPLAPIVEKFLFPTATSTIFGFAFSTSVTKANSCDSDCVVSVVAFFFSSHEKSNTVLNKKILNVFIVFCFKV